MASYCNGRELWWWNCSNCSSWSLTRPWCWSWTQSTRQEFGWFHVLIFLSEYMIKSISKEMSILSSIQPLLQQVISTTKYQHLIGWTLGILSNSLLLWLTVHSALRLVIHLLPHSTTDQRSVTVLVLPPPMLYKFKTSIAKWKMIGKVSEFRKVLEGD